MFCFSCLCLHHLTMLICAFPSVYRPHLAHSVFPHLSWAECLNSLVWMTFVVLGLWALLPTFSFLHFINPEHHHTKLNNPHIDTYDLLTSVLICYTVTHFLFCILLLGREHLPNINPPASRWIVTQSDSPLQCGLVLFGSRSKLHCN